MTKFAPTGDRVLVRRIEEQNVTPGGVVLPDVAVPRSWRGEVVAVGPGSRPRTGIGDPVPLPVAAGDIVHFAKYSGFDIEDDGEELLVLREEHLLAVEA